MPSDQRWRDGVVGKGMRCMGQGTIDSRASLRRAAILMTTFDERVARTLLSKLPPMQRARLRRAMADLEDVDPLERRRAQADFFQETRQQTGKSDARQTAFANDSVELQLQHSAIDRADAPRREDETTPAPPLAFLADVPDDVLLGAIVGEHPQTVAIVLASLAPVQAARLLPGLSDSLRSQALSRLARLEHLPPDALDSIGEHLRRLLADATPRRIGAGAGGRSLQAILAELPQDARHGVANDLGLDPRWLPDDGSASGGSATAAPPRRSGSETGSDGATGPRLARETVDTFEPSGAHDAGDEWHQDTTDPPRQPFDIERVDAFLRQLSTDVLRDALAYLETRDALLALCGLSRRDADRVLRSLPRRQSKQIRKQLAELGSLTIQEIDEAKRQAAEIAGMPSLDKPRETPTKKVETLAAA